MLDKYGQEGELASLWLSKSLPIIEESQKNLSQMPWRWIQPSFSVLADPWTETGQDFYPFEMGGGEKKCFWKSTTQSDKGLVTKLVPSPRPSLEQTSCEKLQSSWLTCEQAGWEGEGEQGAGCLAGCTSPLQWEECSNVSPRVRVSLPPAEEQFGGDREGAYRVSRLPLDVWQWVRCPGWWQLHRAVAWPTECAYCWKELEVTRSTCTR